MLGELAKKDSPADSLELLRELATKESPGELAGVAKGTC
jgi:hypothetical protein